MSSLISLHEAAGEGARLGRGPSGLFSRFQMELIGGRIAAYSSSGSTARIERRVHKNLAQALGEYGFEERLLAAAVDDQPPSSGYRTYLSNETYITIISCVDGYDIVSELKREIQVGREVLSRYWMWAWYDKDNNTVVCDDLYFMKRSVFKDVLISKNDLAKCGFGGNAIKRRKPGPKGFQNDAVSQYACDLLFYQPDISKSLFERLVREKLNSEQIDERWRDPGATAFHRLYGKLWTENRSCR